MKTYLWWLLVVLVGALGCGPAASDSGEGDDDLSDTSGDEDLEPGDSTAGHQSAIELIGINPPEQPWSEMSHEDREMDMIARFHPIFREYFVRHDADEFSEFGCESCHGDDMQARNYEMPNPQLPPVPAAGTPAYQELHTAHHDMMEFMEHEVTPAMQTMLGMGATFTCNGCHPAS